MIPIIDDTRPLGPTLIVRNLVSLDGLGMNRKGGENYFILSLSKEDQIFGYSELDDLREEIFSRKIVSEETRLLPKV